MSLAIKSISKGIGAFFKPQILALMFVPPVLSVVGLLIVFAVFWQSWVTALGGYLGSSWMLRWVQPWVNTEAVGGFLGALFLVLMFMALAFMIAILLTSILVMPVVLRVIGEGEYRALEKKRGGSTAGGVWNTLKISLLFLFFFFLTLPLWLIPGLQILVPLALSAWMNKRIFLYDVLEEYASAEERAAIESKESTSLFGMGMLLGLFAYIPFFFFFIPVLSALSYTYYALSSLKALRTTK